MKRSSWIAAILALLFLIVSCVPQILYDRWKQHEAKSGLDALIAVLPEINGFDAIEEFLFDDSLTAYGQTCYYATAYVVIGSSWPSAEALDIYVEKLQSLGWIPEGTQYETERIMIHGENDRTIVDSGEPSSFIKDAVDYTQLMRIYQSVIVVKLDYMVPSRDKC